MIRASAHEKENEQILAFMAHELKSPLTVILGNASILARYGRPDDLAALRDIHAEAVHALEIIEAFTALREEIHSDPISVPAVCREAISSGDHRLRDALERRGQSVRMRVQEGLPTGRGDRTQLKIVLQNLLQNAAKYGPAGQVIEIDLKATAAGVVVSVLDRGPGIPEAERDSVFGAFVRLPATRHIPGSGLGLALAWRMVRGWGGEIWCEPRDGGGSRFSFTVPAYREESPLRGASAA